MSELAERIEACLGRDRDIDRAICEALDPSWVANMNVRFEQQKTEVRQREGANFDKFWAAREEAIRESCNTAPHYTSSLDAAYRLIPEGWHVGTLTECNEDSQPYCCLTENADPCRDVTGRGGDMILSLAAAAARARGLA